MAELLIDGYDGGEVIGRGGFATVYRAQQLAFGRVVAVKVFHADAADGSTDLEVFQRECRVIGNLETSPNIVTVFDAGASRSGQPYIVMEYAPGGSLSQRLAREGPFRERDVAAIGSKIAAALEIAHRAGVIHRDVKPANILLSSQGEPLLADFGISSIADGTQTNSGAISATIAHAAPEVLNGDRPTPQSDVYSLGSTLFTLLNGRPPYSKSSDSSVVSLISRALNGDLPDLRDQGVSNSLAALLESALSRDLSVRFRNAEAFAEALSSFGRLSSMPNTVPTVDFGALRGRTDRMSPTGIRLPAPREDQRWPTVIEYSRSLRNPRASLLTPMLRDAEVVSDMEGMPASASGQDAVAFKLSLDGAPVVLRCFIRSLPKARERYAAFALHLGENPCDELVAAQWEDAAIAVGNTAWPAVVMPWVPGRPLHYAAEQFLEDASTLRRFAARWLDLLDDLRRKHIAHRALHHGNVIVSDRETMRLLDLDAMWVPSAAHLGAVDRAHTNYRHPSKRASPWGPNGDQFSGFVIYLSLLALAADSSLWRFNTGDNLIFLAKDFAAPNRTAIWAVLGRSTDPAVRSLSDTLAAACMNPAGVGARTVRELASSVGQPELVTFDDETTVPKIPVAGTTAAKPRTNPKSENQSEGGWWAREPASPPQRSAPAPKPSTPPPSDDWWR